MAGSRDQFSVFDFWKLLERGNNFLPIAAAIIWSSCFVQTTFNVIDVVIWISSIQSVHAFLMPNFVKAHVFSHTLHVVPSLELQPRHPYESTSNPPARIRLWISIRWLRVSHALFRSSYIQTVPIGLDEQHDCDSPCYKNPCLNVSIRLLAVTTFGQDVWEDVLPTMYHAQQRLVVR